MALFFADLVREACWGEGAGALALAGALPGHRTFVDVVPSGARFHYAVAGSTHPDEWEVGEGELDGAGKLVRQPIASSAGGGAVDLSPGLKTVALTVLADWFANLAGATEIGEVDGLSEALAGKAAALHGHAIGEVSGLGLALDAKAALAGASFTGAVSAPSLTLGNDLAVADGGTGASSAAAARTNLGLGTLATQNAHAVTIGGGTITGLSSLGAAGNVNVTAGGVLAARNAGADAAMELYADGNGANVAGTNNAGNAFGILNLKGTAVNLRHQNVNVAAIGAGGLDIVAGTLSVAGLQVAGPRRTGWSGPTGPANRAGFDTASVTTQALAERVKALIDDLAAHGLIGS